MGIVFLFCFIPTRTAGIIMVKTICKTLTFIPYIKAKINNDDKSDSLPNSISFVAEFNDCVKWIENRVMEPHELAYTALEYLNRSSVPEENFGIEKYF